MTLNLIRDASEMVQLQEGVIPHTITMTLDQVVQAGKITNPAQTFMIANLVDMFKNGGPHRWPRELNSYGSNAGTEIIEAVKSLKDEEVATLANWLQCALQVPAAYEASPALHNNPDMDTVKWVKLVTRKTD